MQYLSQKTVRPLFSALGQTQDTVGTASLQLWYGIQIRKCDQFRQDEQQREILAQESHRPNPNYTPLDKASDTNRLPKLRRVTIHQTKEDYYGTITRT